MKLIKQSKRKKDLDRCFAVTKSGKRCKRKKFKHDLCKQHHDLQKKVTKELTDYPGGVLRELPEAPISLEGENAARWRQLCEMLYEYGQLRGGYLKMIHHIVLLEELLDDVMEGIEKENVKDYLNEYTTDSGDPGNNINGLWVIKRDTEKELENLRRTLWLTPAGLINLAKGKDIIVKSNKTATGVRKMKSWRN